MARPTNVFTWGSTGAKVEPTTAEKASGVIPGQSLPAQWFNWILNNISLWIAWISTYVPAKDEENIWTAKQSNAVASDTIASRAVTVEPTSDTAYKLIDEIRCYQGIYRRVYITGAGVQIERWETTNAKRNGSAWDKDVAGGESTACVHGHDGAITLYKSPGSDATNGFSFARFGSLQTSAVIQEGWVAMTSGTLTQGVPGTSISGITKISDGVVRFTFGTAFSALTDYRAEVTSTGAGTMVVHRVVKATTHFDVETLDLAGAVPSTYSFDIAVKRLSL